MKELGILLVISIGLQLGLIGLGCMLECIIKYIASVMQSFFGRKLTNIILNYVTFIGVIHHELSHLIIGMITGAKIGKIKLFKLKHNDNSLGTVKLIPRGPKLIEGLQLGLSAIAPMITGIITICILYMYILNNKLSLMGSIGIIYIMFSILIHMTLSKTDIMAYRKGCISITLIIWIILYIVYKVEI